MKKFEDPIYENKSKEQIHIFLVEEGEESTSRQYSVINKWSDEKKTEVNPQWNEIIEEFGDDTITERSLTHWENTDPEARKKRQEAKEVQKRKEELFAFKLEAFDMEEVKKSTDRELKSKIRKAQSKVEVSTYTMMIVLEAHGYIHKHEDNG